MGSTSLELIEHRVTRYGFEDSKIVAMGIDYSTLKHYCKKTFGAEPISDGDKIGYEINFTKYFYKYVPPISLEEIEKDIKEITAEIQELLKEEL